MPTLWSPLACDASSEDHDRWLVKTLKCLWHLQRTLWQSQDSCNMMSATKILQNLTTRKQQAVVTIRYLRRDLRVPRPLAAGSGHSFYWSWQSEPVSLSFPVYTCTVACVQMVPPGTNIAHHLASLETFTCFEMCLCLKTVMTQSHHAAVCKVQCVLQLIFYNHCDVIKVVSLSQSQDSSYPQYQAPGALWSRLYSLTISWESLQELSNSHNDALCHTIQITFRMFTFEENSFCQFSRLSLSSLTTLV